MADFWVFRGVYDVLSWRFGVQERRLVRMAVQIKRGNEDAALITRTEEISTVVVAEIASTLLQVP